MNKFVILVGKLKSPSLINVVKLEVITQNLGEPRYAVDITTSHTTFRGNQNTVDAATQEAVDRLKNHLMVEIQHHQEEIRVLQATLNLLSDLDQKSEEPKD